MLTINKKLFLRMILLTLVLGGGLFLLHYVQADSSTDALRYQAERSAENGRLDRAIAYMKQYLELRPSDYDAAAKLGELILTRGNGRQELSSVLFLYERVLRESPQRDDLRRKLMDICLRLGRYSDAAIHARTLLERAPRDAETWEKLAIAQSAQNKQDEARTSYTTAIDCDPSRVRSYELLAELLIRQLHQPDEAREWIEKMVKANPSSGDAYLVRARYWRSTNKMAEALQDVDRLLVIDPENADGLLMLAELMQAKEEIVKAKIALTDGVALHQKDLRFYRSLSWLELSSGNLSAAIGCLEQGIKQLPQSTELLTPYGDLLVQQGEIEKVRDVIRALTGKSGVESQIQYLTGRVLMQENKWSEAVVLLENLRTEAVSMPGLAAQVNVLLATCYERLGNRDAQTEALKRVLTVDAGHVAARLQFGTICLSSGDLDEAVKEFTVAARSAVAPLSTRVTLGRLLIARGRAGGAAADWNGVNDYLNALKDKYKNTVDPVLLSAEMLMERQQYDAAQKLLRQEAGKKVNDPRIWSVLAAIALEAEGLHAALDVLDEAKGLLGDQVELRLARARTWVVDWQPGREERIRALGFQADDLSETEQLRLLMGLADICASIRDFEGVKLFQKHLAARMPRDLAIRRSLLDTAIQTKDEPLRERLRSEIASLGGATYVAVADARASIENGTFSTAQASEWRQVAQKIVETAPERADAHFVLARLADKSGDKAEADSEYARAAALEPGNFRFQEAHLNLLLRQPDQSLAKKRLEQLYYDPRMPGEAFLGLIEGACADLTREQTGRFLTLVEPLLKKSNVSLLWLARIEQTKGLIEAARALAGRTAAAAPKLIDAWIALVRLQPDLALDTLAAARNTLEGRAFFILCAETLEELRAKRPGWSPEFRKAEDARLFAQACLNANLVRGRIKEATDVLTELASNSNARPEDSNWATRNLAVIAASRGKSAERRQAILTLRTMKAGPDASLEDLRSLSGSLAIVSQHVHGVDRQAVLQQAIDAMKRVTADKDATAKDWYHLSQLDRQIGDSDAYDRAIKEAMRRDDGNLFYVASHVDHLLKDKRLEEVDPYLSRLLQATHDSRAALALMKYFALANLPARGMEIVEQFTQAADPGTPDGPARVRQAADMLNQVARMAAAAKLPCAKVFADGAIAKYRAALRNFPEAVGPLAVLLAFDGRTSAAFDLLTTQKSSLSAKIHTTAAVAVLRVGNATARQFQLVQDWIESALGDYPNASLLKLNLAEVHALKQEYAAAEPLYRDVLKSEPENIVALNNLAWILAPRGDASDEALRCVERAIELSGASGELLDTRARIYIARGNLERAIEDLNLALEYSQTSLRFFHLSIAQFKQLKKVEAVRSFKEARTRGLEPKMIHPNDMATYKVLAAQMPE